MSAPPLAHLVAGDGPPVLLLNGGLMTWAGWGPLATGLLARYRVVRCDFRGQWLSPGPPPATLAGHAADVGALLDSLSLPPVHVVATSFGALAGVLLAASRPQSVASLCLITTTERITDAMWQGCQVGIQASRDAARGGDRGRAWDALLGAAFSPAYRQAQAELLATRRSQMALVPPVWFEHAALLVESLEGLDLRPELGRLACPTLVVAAEQDETFGMEHSQALAAGIPGARLVSLPGGHALVVEQPDALLGVVQGFLAQVVPA